MKDQGKPKKGYGELNNTVNESALTGTYQSAKSLLDNRTDLSGAAKCPAKILHSQTSPCLDRATWPSPN